VRRAAIAATGIAAWYAIHRLGRRSGVTDGEVAADLPGDELVPDPMWQSTRGITINAPPERVWPWIVQMGFPSLRAGWYTPHWLDRLTFGIRNRARTRYAPTCSGSRAATASLIVTTRRPISP
jgi:hypothetical protein